MLNGRLRKRAAGIMRPFQTWSSASPLYRMWLALLLGRLDDYDKAVDQLDDAIEALDDIRYSIDPKHTKNKERHH